MKLLDLVLVAEAVAPPSAQVIYAMAFHGLKQFPSTVGCTCQFFLFLRLRFLGGSCAVLWNFLGYYGYTAEVALALQYDCFICVLECIFIKGWLCRFVALR